MNSAKARQRADDLGARLRQRLAALDAEAQLASSPPVVAGGALVIPAGLLARLSDGRHASLRQAMTRQDAVRAVLAAERSAGRVPVEIPSGHQGYDIESRAKDGPPLFITVKRNIPGSDVFLLTQSEFGLARNAPDRHVLALVAAGPAGAPDIRYLWHVAGTIPDPGFGVSAIELSWQACFEHAGAQR
jgi:hypothetical protein